MPEVKIPYLDIDDNFYIENDIVKVKETATQIGQECSIDEIWDKVKTIVLKAKSYDETHHKESDSWKRC